MVLLGQDAISSQQWKSVGAGAPTTSSSSGDQQHGSTKLYFGNLSTDAGVEDIREFLVEYNISPATITRIVLKRGYAFVEFSNQSTADIVIEKCNGKPMMNTLLKIEPAINSEWQGGGRGRSRGRRLVQLMITNCSLMMNADDVRGLTLESHIGGATVEEVRSAMPGCTAFVIRVPTMNQATQLITDWNNKIIQGSRVNLKILDEVFTEGGAGDTGFQFNSFLQPGFGGDFKGFEGLPYDQREAGGVIDVPLRVLVPNEFIGAIIGRGGSTIRAISKGTGSKVDIFRNGTRGFETPEKPVSFFGAPDKVSEACKKIIEIMMQESLHHRGREFQGDVPLKMFIPNSVVGRIIGKAGTVIKEIMEETETKIHISSLPDYMEQGFGIMRSNRIVTIRGSVDGMIKAESIISNKLRDAYAEGKVRDRELEFANTSMYNDIPLDHPAHYTPFYSYFNSGIQATTPTATVSSRYPLPTSRGAFPLCLNTSQDGISLSRPETVYMYVPDESVGALIGRGGNSIREIIHSSGASIKVLEGIITFNEYQFRRVVIHGGIDSLFMAEYLIYRRVVDERGMPNPMEDPQLTIEMTVPSNLVGRLIGKGGSNIRDIQRQNFCRVKFLTEPDTSIPPPAEGETYVRITGTAHAFIPAQKKIRSLLVKAMSKVFSVSNTMMEGNTSREESPEEEKQQRYPEPEYSHQEN